MHRHVIAPFLACVALALSVPPVLPVSESHGQVPLGTAKKQAPVQGAAGDAEGMPATDEEIDRRIGQIRTRLSELPRGGESVPKEAEGAVATAEEIAEWRRMHLQLAYYLSSREQALKDLKALRHEARRADAGEPSREALPGSPPYPQDALMKLYDRIFALRGALDGLEAQRAIREANLDTFLKAREESEKRIRQAEALLSRSAGKADAARARWKLDLARLRGEKDNEGALAEDASRTVTAERIREGRKELRALEDRYRAAEEASPLPAGELERKIQELESTRKDREKQLDAAILEERSASAALEKTREALRRAREAARPDPVRVAHLTSAEEAEKVRLGTAASRIEILQGALKIQNFEEALWRDRFRFRKDEELGDLRKRQAEVGKVLAQIRVYRENFAKAALAYAPLAQAESERLRSGSLTVKEREAARALVDAYRDRQQLLSQVVEGLARVERVAVRWKEDVDFHLAHASASARAGEKARSLLSVFSRLWNTELYVAEETTVIEGQKIVRPFSVTAGKVFQALVVLLAGLWVTGKMRGPLKRLAAKRLGFDDSRLSQLERKWSFFTFVGLLAFALAFVNIPLAVFAFFGGILAIGIGFGAQHLLGNLISSIILMFDRTISVGDIVEMEGQLGRVKSIGLRSSSLLRFDGVEVLVPNSQFLEQKVTNWTLAERRVRYEIAVGAAYGSPTREVSERILGVVREDARVLGSPEPVVIFESFGDSALMFRTFFWLTLDPEIDNRVICSDLRHRICEALDRAGIVIAFPQRDVHLDAKGPIAVKVVPAEEDGKA